MEVYRPAFAISVQPVHRRMPCGTASSKADAFRAFARSHLKLELYGTYTNNKNHKAPERVILQDAENLRHNLLERCRKILDSEDDFEIMTVFDDHEQVISHLQSLLKQY